MRPRKKDRHLPQCMYHKHGAYYLVRKSKWLRLGEDYQESLLEYARKMSQATQGGMPDLIDRAMKYHFKKKKLAANTVLQYEAAAERLKVEGRAVSEDMTMGQLRTRMREDVSNLELSARQLAAEAGCPMAMPQKGGEANQPAGGQPRTY